MLAGSSLCGGSSSCAGCLGSAVDRHHPHNCCSHGRARDGRGSPPPAPLSPWFNPVSQFFERRIWRRVFCQAEDSNRARGWVHPEEILVPAGSELETVNSQNNILGNSTLRRRLRQTAGSSPGPSARFGITTVRLLFGGF